VPSNESPLGPEWATKDGAIVRRVLAGETELFGELVSRYREAFGRYAVSLVGDSDSAADAMQEAFIRAYRSLATCRNPERFGAWFFRILTNQCHNVRRSRRTEIDIAAVDPPGPGATDAATRQHELHDAIDAALDALTPEQREAFVMKHIDGRSYEEMAQLLGSGVDALKMRVHRARDRLRVLLRDLG
jgi:RNA polymerase sigma-70 factor (ECF subfamily)